MQTAPPPSPQRFGLGPVLFACLASLEGWLVLEDVGFRDSGEIATAAQVLGVAHPTGFALDMLWLKAWTLIPLGHIAFRQNLAVGIASALALSLIAVLCTRIARRAGAGALASNVGALVAVSALSAWPTFIIAARAVEVYASALAAVAGCALLLESGAPAAAALVAGLCAGLHVTAGLYTGLLVLVYLVASGRMLGLERARRSALSICASAVLGALVVSYLPLASARDPVLDWGDPETLRALFQHLSAARIRDSYHAQMLGVGDPRAAGRLLAQLTAFGPALALTPFAFVVLARRARLVLWALLGLLAVDASYALFVNPMGIEDYQVGHTAGAALALSAGLGAAALVSLLSGRGRVWAPRVAGVAALSLCAFMLARSPRYARADGYAASELLGSAGPFAALPPRTVVLCSGDDGCAVGLFSLYVEGVRPDMDIAPAQHLWDETVLRNLEALRLSPPRAVHVAAQERALVARRRVRALAAAVSARPVVWDDADTLQQAGVSAAARATGVGAYLEVARPGGARWPKGVIRALDRARRARLREGKPKAPWARAAWARAYGVLGRAGLATGNARQALIAMRRAAALNPGDAVVWTNLGVALETVGDLRGAIASTERALRADATRATPWVNLARLHRKRNGAGAARRVLELARRARVDDPRLDALESELSGDPRAAGDTARGKSVIP